jgi:DNA-binding NarL/FixJ family response regulator
MQQTHVLLLQSDPNVAQTLANSLANSFHGVHVAKSVDEIRHVAAKYQPFAIIVDLETATLSEVETLKRDFQHTRIVCNHRAADEEMWSRSLNVGADDCCPTADMRSILAAAIPNALSRTHAAA